MKAFKAPRKLSELTQDLKISSKKRKWPGTDEEDSNEDVSHMEADDIEGDGSAEDLSDDFDDILLQQLLAGQKENLKTLNLLAHYLKSLLELHHSSLPELQKALITMKESVGASSSRTSKSASASKASKSTPPTPTPQS